ncbi:MAG: epimerase [Candidatus Solibacter sp.]
MKVILFGATGMVGQGVLLECLDSSAVESVLAVGRHATGRQHPKLKEIQHADFTDFRAIESEFAGGDACFYCMGVSSLGVAEADYRRLTYDFALAAARSMARVAPAITFIYVSGSGTDSSEKGSLMWARVKGKTENEILALLPNAYAFRPAYIQPLRGVVAATGWLRTLYSVVGPLFPVWKLLFGKYVTTTVQVGRAMLHVARHGAPKRVLENADISGLGSA